MKTNHIIVIIVIAVILYLWYDNHQEEKAEQAEKIKDGHRAKKIALAAKWAAMPNKPVKQNPDFLEPEVEANPNGSGNWTEENTPDELNDFLQKRAEYLANQFDGGLPDHVQENEL